MDRYESNGNDLLEEEAYRPVMAVRIPTSVLNDGPTILLSAGLGAYVGRAVSLDSRWGISWGWPAIFLAIAFVGLCLWFWRGYARDRKSAVKEQRSLESHTKIDDTHRMMTELYHQVSTSETVTTNTVTRSGSANFDLGGLNITARGIVTHPEEGRD